MLFHQQICFHAEPEDFNCFLEVRCCFFNSGSDDIGLPFFLNDTFDLGLKSGIPFLIFVFFNFVRVAINFTVMVDYLVVNDAHPRAKFSFAFVELELGKVFHRATRTSWVKSSLSF